MKIEIELTESLKTLTSDMLELPVFYKLEKGEVSQNGFQFLMKQRYLAAKDFMKLLEAIIRMAKDRKLVNIEKALTDNWSDEQGLERKSQKELKIGSHEDWRVDFYKGLHISKVELLDTTPTKETAFYQKTITDLIDSNNLEKCLGAFLFLEYNIPQEFKVLIGICERLFPKNFNLDDSLDKETRKRNKRHRLYLFHHIKHDEQQHFVEIESAIQLDKNSLDVPKMHEGIHSMSFAKNTFFSSNFHDMN
ncbi:MAG: thiaminase [Flammeovirgaceae bacterium]|jgi:thiaminase